MNQRLDALAKANGLRSDLAKIRAELRAGERTLHDLLRDPPECTLHVLVPELLLVARGFGGEKLRKLGLAAIRAQVNLLVPLRRLPESSRLWLADELDPAHKSARPERVYLTDTQREIVGVLGVEGTMSGTHLGEVLDLSVGGSLCALHKAGLIEARGEKSKVKRWALTDRGYREWQRITPVLSGLNGRAA